MTAGSYIAIAMVRTYQVVLSPLKGLFFGTGSCCRFTPTCSCYAIESFRAHGLLRGFQLTVRRLLRCHPWGGAGYDPVPSGSVHPAPLAAPVPPLNLSAHE